MDILIMCKQCGQVLFHDRASDSHSNEIANSQFIKGMEEKPCPHCLSVGERDVLQKQTRKEV